MAPSIKTPALAYFHSATSTFRVSVTIVVLRRDHPYVTCYTEGFSHFVTSMTAPVASG